MHAGNALPGQGKMGVLGKCGGCYANGSAQADGSNNFIHDTEAFPVWKNTFSSFPRQWRLLSRPLYEKRAVRKQADSPFEILTARP